MKKYKLKKDLPLAKAGTIVKLEETPVKSGLRLIFCIKNTEQSIGTIDVNDINEWLKEIHEKPNSVWELMEGDDIYVMRYCDFISWQKWGEQFFDDRMNGNIYLSKEEAEKELQKRKAIQKIKRYCWENGIETEYGEERNDKLFYIEIDGEFEGQINFDSFPPVFSPIGYFSYENAQKILDNFREELKIILE